MSTLLKYFKPYISILLFIVLYQFTRAYGLIEIPTYTADIVNNGIQGYGVTSNIPYIMTENDYNIILSLLNEEEQTLLNSSYSYITQDEISLSLAKEYHLTPTSNYYVFVDSSNKYSYNEESVNNLNTILSSPMMFISITSGDVPIPNNSNFAIPQDISKTPEENVPRFYEFFKSYTNELPSIQQDTLAKMGTKQLLINANVDMNAYQMSYILSAGLKMLLISFGITLVIIRAYMLVAKVTTEVTATIRHDLYTKILSFSNYELDDLSTSSLITRATNDITQVSRFIAMFLQMALFAPILAIVAIRKSYMSSFQMFMISLSAVMCILLLIAVVILFTIPKFKLNQKLVDRLNLVTREILSGILVIRAFSNEKRMNKKFADTNQQSMNNTLFIGRMMGTIFPLVTFILNITMVSIVWFGAKNVDAGVMLAGDIFANIQYSASLIFSFIMLSMLLFIFPRAQVSAQRIKEVLEKEEQIKSGNKTISQKVNGIVQFNNVSFKYNDASDSLPVLENISFTAKPNEVTAIIGSTGSGKSTIVNLIPRFYNVSEGSITIDGVNIKDYTLESLHEQIAIIPQKNLLFSGSVKSNIKFSDNTISDEQMIKSADISQATEFITNLDNQFDADISQGGKNVSGGQKQRLSIARAIASNRPILVFDDSFSALDYSTDSKLRNAIKENLKDVTTIIVAQRVNTIRKAEQIIVLDEGKIVGKGTHNELIKTCDVYKEIALSQIPEEELYNE